MRLCVRDEYNINENKLIINELINKIASKEEELCGESSSQPIERSSRKKLPPHSLDMDAKNYIYFSREHGEFFNFYKYFFMAFAECSREFCHILLTFYDINFFITFWNNKIDYFKK